MSGPPSCDRLFCTCPLYHGDEDTKKDPVGLICDGDISCRCGRYHDHDITISPVIHPTVEIKKTYIKFAKIVPSAIIPTRGTPRSAGFDLHALETTTITPGAGNIPVRTGIAIVMPNGTYGRIAMRSGLAMKQHLTVSAGVIDNDYTGEIKVLVSSTLGNPEQSYTINAGDRFAQIVIEQINTSESIEIPYNQVQGNEMIKHLGFGSTGI